MPQTRDRNRLVSNRSAEDSIRDRVPFHNVNGSFSGTNCAVVTVGELGRIDMLKVTRAQHADDFYVVRSYETPIAFFVDGRWTIPDVFYSNTTSKHQAIVRKALA